MNRLRSAELSGENDKLRRELERTTKILEVGGLKQSVSTVPATFLQCGNENTGSGAAEASGRGTRCWRWSRPHPLGKRAVPLFWV